MIKPEEKTIVCWIFAAIVIIIIFSVSYNYGLFIGTLRGIHKSSGIEWMCNKTNGTMEDNGYCLLDDLSSGISTAYKHYFNCSWGKFTVISNYRYDNINFIEYRLWFMQCRRTKVMELI